MRSKSLSCLISLNSPLFIARISLPVVAIDIADHGCGQDVADLSDVVQEEELAIQGLALLLRRPEG